ncbi:MAG TPA: ABC transporter permease subunit [Acidimicrobiia bacterium]
MTTTAQSRPPFWRNQRVLRVVVQLAALGVTALILYVLWFNLTNNMRAAGLPTDFGALDQPLGVDIPGSSIRPGAPVWRGILVGIKNTLALVVVGIPVLTVLGVVIGIGRLSTNWLVAKVCTLYVEIIRNLPPLLLIYFMFNAVFLQLPPLQESITAGGWLVINNRFVAVTAFTHREQYMMFWWVVAAAVVVGIIVAIVRTRRWHATGEPHHRVLWFLGIVIGVAIVAWLLLDRPIGLSRPVLEGRVVTGGFMGFSAYFAVLIALAMYTASHVAEITRGSILAVPKGQTEAANSLALTTFQRLRYVTLPQAMRIAVPPIISQYLNFTKNTSLATAVGYAELTRITFQAIGNGRPAPQLVFVLAMAYLAFSLFISLVVNILNRRLQYVT